MKDLMSESIKKNWINVIENNTIDDFYLVIGKIRNDINILEGYVFS